jgi:predicted cobalt transporter CbtA
MTAGISSAFPATDIAMTKDLLWRGMLAGVLAAVLATIFARIVAEPQIDLAIAVEAARAPHPLSGMAVSGELVSRATQQGLGLLTAMVLYGAAVGGLFSLVFAYGYGRVARIGPRSFALILAMLAFGLIVLVPATKYPQTPPAVGRHETVGLRTAAYFAMIALSIGAAVLASKMRGILTRRMGGFDASLGAFGIYAILVGLGQSLLPHIDEVPSGFPASLLWNFRVASMATQLLLWIMIGILFGLMAEYRLHRR